MIKTFGSRTVSRYGSLEPGTRWSSKTPTRRSWVGPNSATAAADALAAHDTEHVNLLFNNVGLSGGGSLFTDTRESWDRCFDVCFHGVRYGTLAFLDALVVSEEGHIVNTSSVNGFWASISDRPHTAYSAAKFAVKGFTEALMTDLAVNAPHVKASVVMPGHIGTSIVQNFHREPDARSAASNPHGENHTHHSNIGRPWRTRARCVRR